ncbi:MAG: hypothetical protein R3B90_02515 [Planctomycetaceae bacterium]
MGSSTPANGVEQIVRCDANGNVETVVTEALQRPRGAGEWHRLLHRPREQRRVWRFTVQMDRRASPTKRIARPGRDHGLAGPDALLTVADTQGRFTYSFQIQPDGQLAHKQTYGHLHVPDDTHESGADGMAVDTEGRLYVTTRVGLQVLDQLGRASI